MKIDTHDENVEFIVLSVNEARDVTDEVISKIEHALDQAQAHVFTDAANESYVIIKINK